MATEMICKDVVFHFNKKHLEDPTIPMWCLKTKGQTFYVNHVDCEIPWSTKETPDNPSTKGSLKIKDCVLIIDDNNNATLKKVRLIDKMMVKSEPLYTTRIIFGYQSPMHVALNNKEYEHSKFKKIKGSCGSSFVVCDMLEKVEVTHASLKYDFRVLMPNEDYHKQYDGKKDHIVSKEPEDYYG